ncbi:MAG: tol-pal system-associated acyl-CoA thioesterase [Gammaproteobacteria bacterium]
MKAFLWQVRVYYEDTDSGGVVYHSNYLKFMERARTEWLRSLGFEQDALARDEGVIFAVRSVLMEFLKPGRFNQLLDICSKIVQRGKASMTLDQTISADGDVLCTGRVKLACLDAATLRPRSIPKPIFGEIHRDD